MRYRYERNQRTSAVSIISIVAFAMIACAARAQDTQGYAPFPAPAPGHVTDLAGVLTLDQRATLNSLLNNHERSTRVEIRVLTINAMSDYPGTPNGSIEAFATGLFNRWRIGSASSNDGVLLLVSVKDRKVRIEVGKGYGRSMDAAALRIMSNVIVPRLRANDFAAGVREGADALIKEFNGRPAAQSAQRPIPPITNQYPPMPNANFPQAVTQLPRSGPRVTEAMLGAFIIIVFALLAVAIVAKYALQEVASGRRSRRRDWNHTDGFILGSMMGSESNHSTYDSTSISSSFSSFDSGSSDSSSSSDSGGSSDGGGASGDC